MRPSYLLAGEPNIDDAEILEPVPTFMQVQEGAESGMQVHAPVHTEKTPINDDLHEPASSRTQVHAPEYNSDMVDFLKGQIHVKDDQIKVKDDQIAAMLERDRETNFLIRELQTQLSSTVQLIAGTRKETPHSVENPMGQSTVQ